MYKSLNFRICLRLAILGALTVCLWQFVNRVPARGFMQTGRKVSVEVRQLPPQNGVVPVELKCGMAQLSAPNTMQNYSCIIGNNTNKKIRSFSLIYTDVNEQDGKEFKASRFITFDMLIHLDFKESSTDKSIPPGGEYTLTPAGPTSYENAVIKKVEVELDHVEFDDGNVIGPNEGGVKIITRRREGAAKYKQWLMQKYDGKDRSENAIVLLIQMAPDSPSELGLVDDGLEQGAEMYRVLLLKRYNTFGAAELRKLFDR